jgi:hypothetical protein
VAKTIFILLVVICLLAAVASFLAAKFMNQAEILRAKQEMEGMRALRDSLETRIAERDILIAGLEGQNEDLMSEAEVLRAEADSLEEERRLAVAAAFKLFQPEDYMAQLSEAYPEFSRSRWGFTEIYNEEFGVRIQYFVVPTQFTTAFLQDHIDAVSYREQSHKLRQVDTLSLQVIAYKDSVITLERLNKDAYKLGYDDAFARYESLNEKYINLLENPQVKLGFTGWGTLLGSAVVGAAAGYAAGSN